MSVLTILKKLKETWKRGERREKRCIEKKRNQTPQKTLPYTLKPNQTKPNQTKPNQPNQAKKIGPKQPAKVHGGSTMPIGHRLPPKMVKLKSKRASKANYRKLHR